MWLVICKVYSLTKKNTVWSETRHRKFYSGAEVESKWKKVWREKLKQMLQQQLKMCSFTFYAVFFWHITHNIIKSEIRCSATWLKFLDTLITICNIDNAEQTSPTISAVKYNILCASATWLDLTKLRVDSTCKPSVNRLALPWAREPP